MLKSEVEPETSSPCSSSHTIPFSAAALPSGCCGLSLRHRLCLRTAASYVRIESSRRSARRTSRPVTGEARARALDGSETNMERSFSSDSEKQGGGLEPVADAWSPPVFVSSPEESDSMLLDDDEHGDEAEAGGGARRETIPRHTSDAERRIKSRPGLASISSSSPMPSIPSCRQEDDENSCRARVYRGKDRNDGGSSSLSSCPSSVLLLSLSSRCLPPLLRWRKRPTDPGLTWTARLRRKEANWMSSRWGLLVSLLPMPLPPFPLP
mmetsp:Transcript_4190/g.11562  ORF Transcript_4190/g.11562 Transcript_4190/m.11562 type:complete len:267 (+) Transcript_4190:2031-2831(+)